MQQRHVLSIVSVTAIAGVLVAGLWGIKPPPARTPSAPAAAALPDFTSFADAQARKDYFLRFLKPIVSAANQRIRENRHRLKPLADALLQGQELDPEQWRWMRRLAQRYDVPADHRARAAVALDLLRRVDIIPVSLVLVQAAKESAWGTSRFAQEGNNLFGQHCFDPGCGIVPAHRDKGGRHEVQSFPTVQASVRSYLHNLNTHPRYERLRAIREQLRARGEPLTALALVRGLRFYSERRQTYIDEVRQMIRNLHLGPRTEGP